MFVIRQDDLQGKASRELVALHLAGMRSNTPTGHVFAMGIEALCSPGVIVWSAWADARIAAIAALKMLGNDQAELKSMRTHPALLRRGAASALLEHIIECAGRSGIRRISLETGRGPAFEPALTLYRKHGFIEGPPFGDYVGSEFNQFFHRDI